MPDGMLLLEMVAIFLVLPAAYLLLPVRLPALPLLWAVAGYAWWQLWREPGFDRRLLWRGDAVASVLPQIAATFAIAAMAIWWGVRQWRPDLVWNLVRTHRGLWAAVSLLYPVLSVYPQGVLYRAFFFHRYAVFFPRPWEMILASAVAFAFVHIVFRNPLAVGLTLAGGVLFAFRYQQTGGSLAASCLEHALCGEWLFTVGLGGYLYTGTMSTVGAALKR